MLAAVCGSAGSYPTGVENDREIGDGSGNRLADVLGAGKRDDPAAAGEALRPADAHKAVVRRRDADRPASVAAHAHGSEIGGDSGTGAAAGTAGVAVQRIRVAGLTEERAERGDAVGELVHVRLGDDDPPPRAAF